MDLNRKMRRKLKLVLGAELDRTIARRSCGGCTACCTVLAIPELGKPMAVKCEHAEDGCRIYGQRPKPCREYLCGWKVGFGEEDQRPDLLGLLLSPTVPGTPGHPAMLAYELEPGAFARHTDYLHAAAQATLVMLMREGIPRRVMGPEHRMLGMKSVLEEIRRLNLEARRERPCGSGHD